MKNKLFKIILTTIGIIIGIIAFLWVAIFIIGCFFISYMPTI